MSDLYLTHFDIQMIAASAGFPNPNRAAAVAMAESSGRPWVVNSIGCVGLWQINQPVHVKSHPTWTKEWLKDPANNAKAAFVLSNGGKDWSPWEAYTGSDGKGSDGPWRKYVKGNEWHDAPGNAIDAAGDLVDGAVATAEELSRIAQAVAKAGNWLSNPANWVRIGYVVGGGVLVFVGVGMVAKDTPVGKAAVKAAGMVVTKGKSKAASRSKSKADAKKRTARTGEAYDKVRARAQARDDAKKEKSS